MLLIQVEYEKYTSSDYLFAPLEELIAVLCCIVKETQKYFVLICSLTARSSLQQGILYSFNSIYITNIFALSFDT